MPSTQILETLRNGRSVITIALPLMMRLEAGVLMVLMYYVPVTVLLKRYIYVTISL